jgi:hypothetical protein
LSSTEFIAAVEGQTQEPKKAEQVKRARVKNEIIDYVKPTSQNPEAVWAMAGIKPASMQLEAAHPPGTYTTFVSAKHTTEMVTGRLSHSFLAADQKPMGTSSVNANAGASPRSKNKKPTTLSLWLTFEGKRD